MSGNKTIKHHNVFKNYSTSTLRIELNKEIALDVVRISSIQAILNGCWPIPLPISQPIQLRFSVTLTVVFLSLKAEG